MTSMIESTYPYDFSSVKDLPIEEKLSIVEYLNGEPPKDNLSEESKAVLRKILTVRFLGNSQFFPQELFPDNW